MPKKPSDELFDLAALSQILSGLSGSKKPPTVPDGVANLVQKHFLRALSVVVDVRALVEEARVPLTPELERAIRTTVAELQEFLASIDNKRS